MPVRPGGYEGPIMPDDNIIRIRLSMQGRPLKSFSFNKDVITVGRDPAADVFLDNPSISREHVRFERLPNGHFCMKDPGSANGAYLNEERVQGAMIYNGDVVRIGKFSLWISLERDRRGTVDEPEVRQAADTATRTMMLTPEEINKLMSISREREVVAPELPRALPAGTAPAATERSSESRIVSLLGLGAALVLATSLGVAVAWLFLR
jgi:predicted component of type VI protein secretion system